MRMQRRNAKDSRVKETEKTRGVEMNAKDNEKRILSKRNGKE